MKNDDFKIIINQLLAPLGYKRRGNFWRLETEQLEKICYLQKSKFSNLYYFNYGLNFKNLEYDEVVSHIGSRLSQSQAFDLENSMADSNRTKLLETIISNELHLVSKLDTELDVINNLHKVTHPNAIPLKVKEYLNLKN